MEKTVSRAKSWLAAIITILLCTQTCTAQNGDIRLLRSINEHRNKSLDGLMNGITNTAYPVSVAVPLTELIVGSINHDSTTLRNGLQTVAGLAVTTVLTYGLKYAVNRTRPYITYPDIQPYTVDNDPSFPSGHTSFAFSTATSLSLCYPRWYVIVPSYAWAVAVGYSRLDLGMHYPSDVLAGAIIGAGSSWLAYQGNKWLQHHKHKKVPVEH